MSMFADASIGILMLVAANGLAAAAGENDPAEAATPPFDASAPESMLVGLGGFQGRIDLSAYVDGERWPKKMAYGVCLRTGEAMERETDEREDLGTVGFFDTSDKEGGAVLAHEIDLPAVPSAGGATFDVWVLPASQLPRGKVQGCSVPNTLLPGRTSGFGETAGNATESRANRVQQDREPYGGIATLNSFVVPGWMSLLPPLMTLLAAVAVKQVIIALLVGIWVGCSLIHGGNPLISFLRTFDTYFVDAFVNDGHAGVLLFTVIVGGLIALVRRSGGALGLANEAQRFMRGRVSGQAATVALGALVFFDDYASMLIVGNSLQATLPSIATSRAKFGLIVHVMGACLPSFFPVSSWVGVELGYIKGQYKALPGTPIYDRDPFLECIESIKYRFFPVLALMFVVLLVVTQRDFPGTSMWKEERQAVLADRRKRDMRKHGGRSSVEDMTNGGEGDEAQKEGSSDGDGKDVEKAVEDGSALDAAQATLSTADDDLAPPSGTPLRWYNAAIPFGSIIVGTFVAMYVDGLHEISLIHENSRPPSSMANAFAYADSVNALIWSSAGSWFLTMILVVGQRIVTIDDAMAAWTKGATEIFEPCLVLILAWALGDVIRDVHTASFLATTLASGLPACWLSPIVTLLAYGLSYACGSSFGSMGILFPLTIPLAWTLSGDEDVVVQCVGAILGGSLFGGTCSPIGDGTILTAASTGCDLDLHVRTITPYMGIVGGVAWTFGTVPVAMGWYGAAVALPLCVVVLLISLMVFGADSRHEDNEDDGDVAASDIAPRQSRALTKSWFSGVFLTSDAKGRSEIDVVKPCGKDVAKPRDKSDNSTAAATPLKEPLLA